MVNGSTRDGFSISPPGCVCHAQPFAKKEIYHVNTCAVLHPCCPTLSFDFIQDTSMVSLKFPSNSPSSPAHHMGAFITRVQKLGQEKKFLARMHFTCPNINANFHSTIQAQLLLVQKRGRTRILRRLQPNLASGHRIISGPELVSTHLNLYSHDEPASHSDVTRNIEYGRLY
jgi:hypothetical protein